MVGKTMARGKLVVTRAGAEPLIEVGLQLNFNELDGLVSCLKELRREMEAREAVLQAEGGLTRTVYATYRLNGLGG